MLCQPVKLERLILLISWQSEDKGSEVGGSEVQRFKGSDVQRLK